MAKHPLVKSSVSHDPSEITVICWLKKHVLLSMLKTT